MFGDSLLADEGFALSFKNHVTAPLSVNASAEEVSIRKITPPKGLMVVSSYILNTLHLLQLEFAKYVNYGL